MAGPETFVALFACLLAGVSPRAESRGKLAGLTHYDEQRRRQTCLCWPIITVAGVQLEAGVGAIEHAAAYFRVLGHF